MNCRLSHVLLGAIVLCGAITAGTFAWQDSKANKPATTTDDEAAEPQHQGQGMPDLIGALKESPGCLGIEVGQMMSGKRVIFAWFEDKAAVATWYYSEVHQQAMDMFFDETVPDFKPLEGVSDDAGPFLVIASVTMAEESEFKETSLPVSQIAIEVYEPVTGGLFLGSRFAPDEVIVENMTDYTPEASEK